MNIRTISVGILYCLCSSTLAAQEALLPSSGGFAERFKQLDRNDDGMVSREEGKSLPFFGAADTNKDGFLNTEEVQAYFVARRTGQPANPRSPTEPSPPVAAPPQAQPDGFVVDDVSVGTPGISYADPEFLSEVNRMVFQTGGSGVQEIWTADLNPLTGLLVSDYVRVDTLVEITFTSDAGGQPLAKPVIKLVAGLWWRKVKPWGVNEDEPTSVAVRDDVTGKWTISTIAKAVNGSPGDVRALAMHTDAKTGRQYLFAGGGDGLVYRGSYDPASSGGLKWEVDPGLPKTARLVTFTECEGALYVAGGLVENNGVNPMRGEVSAGEIRRDGGVFRRVDGKDSSWELVYRWPFAGPRFNEHLMRGLSVVPDPKNRANPVILGGLEDPPLIQRIDPVTGQATDELNYMKYFQRVFGDRPNKGLWVNAVMTNQLEPFTHPATGERMHFVTAYIMHPKDPETPNNGAWFLVRKLDGTYEHGEIYPEGGLPSGHSLHGVRSIIESPFPEESGKVWYFAGHGAERKLLHNTAWIYKGTLKAKQS